MLPLGSGPSSWAPSISPTVTTKWKLVEDIILSFTFVELHWLQIIGISQPWARMFPTANCNCMEVNKVIIWPTESLLLEMMCEKEKLQFESLKHREKW